ncbi:helix-turn-helix domain-containing protein [Nocardioides sp. WS12]|uniref:helix-turn-helix domain-containing protein n=1 Tax=Nocardioides sp. WS12 TaxID=2486272 RepID=UPI0015FBA69B|nr:helix-turn-helix domain-containing protein [Nocardioides sp. WS12]
MNRPLTVAGLLADPVLAGAQVIAGSAGTANVVEDVRFLGPADGELRGQLVVCVESAVSPPYRLDALVRLAGTAEAAALLVVGDSITPLLSGIRLADRLGLPVIGIACPDPISLVQELTVQVRAPELARARTIDRALRQLSAKRTGQEILRTAEGVLSTSLSLVAVDGARILGEPFPGEPGLHLDQPVPQVGRGVLLHPVLDPQVNRLAAWLVCPVDHSSDLRTDVLSTGLAIIEPFLRSWLSGQRAEIEKDTAVKSQVLAEIISGRDSVSRDVVEHATSLGWRLSGWHIGMHVLATANRPVTDRRGTGEQLAQALTERGVSIAAAIKRGRGWALWTSSETEPNTSSARQLLRTVRLVVADLPNEWGLAVGIGRPGSGAAGLADTLSEARDAADLARSHDFRPAVEHADELGVARLLATWQRSEVTRAFAESALAPLRESEALMTTLRAYLESGCSVVLTAEALGVHRNTVTTRVQQIRERLGLDLDEPSQRLALQVACRAIE